MDNKGISGAYDMGGIVGYAKSGTTIESCTVMDGRVRTSSGYAGGLVGLMDNSTVIDCRVYDLDVKAGANYSGGLIGCAYGSQLIFNAVDNVTVEGYSYVGGLCGAIHGQSQVEQAVTNAVVNADASYAGGISGIIYEKSTVVGAKTSGDVSADFYAGGIVGSLVSSSTLNITCAYGNITTSGYISGGLVGEAIACAISNSYARGNVSGTTGVGGLVGYFSGSGTTKDKSVTNCYSSGKVTGTGTGEYGAFNGRSGVVYKGTNYYDMNTANVAQGYGTAGSPTGAVGTFPQGRTTSQMMHESTFEGWDFSHIWQIDDGTSYPYLCFFSVDTTRP
jgi:hypothetical protein